MNKKVLVLAILSILILQISATDKQWINALDLTIEGMGWQKNIENYTRLPLHYQDSVTEKVWDLSRNSSGISINFTVSGTESIEAKWTLTKNVYMAHMTPVGINGLDLYVKLNGKWQWAGIGKPAKNGLEQEALIRKGFDPAKTYECKLYLPLYTGITDLKIGFSADAAVKASQPAAKKPLVFYGSSILHGCSASRNGMAFPALLGRHFEVPIVNLGFSGNGWGEPYFGNILGEIDASVYIIDCLPNMWRFSKEEIQARLMSLTKRLHAAQPHTPIIFVEDRSYTHPNLTAEIKVYEPRMAMQAAYKELKKEIKALYYVKGDTLIGTDNEALIDGSHPTDLGMYRYFQALKPTVAKALRKSK